MRQLTFDDLFEILSGAEEEQVQTSDKPGDPEEKSIPALLDDLVRKQLKYMLKYPKGVLSEDAEVLHILMSLQRN